MAEHSRTSDFHVGDRVEVTRLKYAKVPVGAQGEVRNIYAGSIRVAIDGLQNLCSQYGHFYFEAKHLKIIHTEGSTIMTGNYNVAEVQFLEGTNSDRKYRYACYDRGIVEGDICVVKTAHHGFSIAKVVGFVETDEELTREIVCKADFSEYNKRVESRKRMAELKDLMNVRAKQLQDVALFKMLAKDDTEMASMLAEFETLMGGLG